jgi:hypothetical protein
MSAKRASTKTASPTQATPALNALMIGGAVAFGLWQLVNRGRMTWPPTQFLAGLYTVAGCLALVGPIVLFRKSAAEGGLGELVWLSGGALVWLHNLAASLRGNLPLGSLATPLGYQPMGLTVLAVFLAGWRARPAAGAGWSWTNVVGWGLGVFWVGMGLTTLIPGPMSGLASR